MLRPNAAHIRADLTGGDGAAGLSELHQTSAPNDQTQPDIITQENGLFSPVMTREAALAVKETKQTAEAYMRTCIVSCGRKDKRRKGGGQTVRIAW